MAVADGTRTSTFATTPRSSEFRNHLKRAGLPPATVRVKADLLISPAFRRQFPTAIPKLCVPAVDPSENVIGTVSLAATFGTTTLN